MDLHPIKITIQIGEPTIDHDFIKRSYEAAEFWGVDTRAIDKLIKKYPKRFYKQPKKIVMTVCGEQRNET